jgi:hypothetical protein
LSINQQHTESEFSHLRGQELIQALKEKYKKPQPNGMSQEKQTSEFSHLNGSELIQALKEKYKKPQTKPAETSLGNFAATSGKVIASGAAGAVPDLLTMPYNLLATAHNTQRQAIDPEIRRIGAAFNPDAPDMPYDVDLPMIPSATEAIDKGIDRLTDGYTTTPENQKWFFDGLKMAASVATPGGLGKAATHLGAKTLGSAFNAIGSLKPSALAGAGAAGAATEAAQQAGHSGGRSLGEGLGAGLLADLAVRKLSPESLKRGVVSLTGFGKGNLNVKGVEAAERLGIDIPNIGFTDSKAANLAAQLVGKTPFVGDKLKDRFTKASQEYKTKFEEMLDSVGSSTTDEVSKEIHSKYDLMRKSLPESDTVLAKDLLNTIYRLENSLDSTVHAAPTKALLDITGKIKDQIVGKVPSLPEGFEKMAPEARAKIRELVNAQTELKPISVKKLVRQNTELNKFMKDRNLFDRSDADTLNLLRRVQSATNRELEAYGRSKNPEFLERLKDANTTYAKTAKRDALDQLLSDKLKLGSDKEEVAYQSLATLLKKHKNEKMLKNNLGSEHKRLNDFVEAAESLALMTKNNPNSSGTATTNFVLGMIFNPVMLFKAAVGSTAAYQLLTNKRFLNLATRYAKEPTPALSNQISNIFQQETGMSIQTANKIMHEKKEE